MGIGVLMTLFLALGVISYFQFGQIDENIGQIIQSKALGKRAVDLHERYKELDCALAKAKDVRNKLNAKSVKATQAADTCCWKTA